MDCVVIREELFAYHFGACEDADRDRIDEHLVSCSQCLRFYLALKRRIEAGDSEKPSQETRERLREHVLRKFKPRRVSKLAAIFKRRIPLYQGVFAVAVAACVALGAPSALRVVRSSADAPSGVEPRVDTARHAAESLSIF
jgi:predicted anti-sigma-YlaC factor YlaD